MENSSTEYPKITYLSAGRRSFKVDPKDPNFDRPISELTKVYESPYKHTVIRQPDYGEFEIIVKEPLTPNEYFINLNN